MRKIHLDKGKLLLTYVAWGLSVGVAALAVIAWADAIGWRIAGLSTYMWFPLFGMVAFSLMWAHYMVTAICRVLGLDPASLRFYYRTTGWVVTVALLLHPGLLAWQLWVDGFGLPPGSYMGYAASELAWVVWLGVFGFTAFMAYELWRWFDKKRWWRLVSWASELAMVAIFYHALQLGSHMGVSWLRTLWLLLGISMVAALAYLHWTAYTARRDPEPWHTWDGAVGVLVTGSGVLVLLVVSIPLLL